MPQEAAGFKPKNEMIRIGNFENRLVNLTLGRGNR